MTDLFNALRELKQDVVRNIVKIIPSSQIFSDLMEDKNDDKLIDKAISFVVHRENLNLDSQFLYTTAIHYPFESDHWMASRYSDGSFPIWYGAIDGKTAIYETAFNALKNELTILSELDAGYSIDRIRAVYNVSCHGVLVDLTNQKTQYPYLIADNHSETQLIGKKLYQQGFPGLLAPSARYKDGISVNIFQQRILSSPRLQSELTYRIFPKKMQVIVLHEEKPLENIQF